MASGHRSFSVWRATGRPPPPVRTPSTLWNPARCLGCCDWTKARSCVLWPAPPSVFTLQPIMSSASSKSTEPQSSNAPCCKLLSKYTNCLKVLEEYTYFFYGRLTYRGFLLFFFLSFIQSSFILPIYLHFKEKLVLVDFCLLDCFGTDFRIKLRSTVNKMP